MTLRVVLVDDVPEVLGLVRTALRFRGGFAVVGEAEDAAHAVALAREQEPDIVVLDLGLPDIAGRDVLARVRDASPASKIVVFSGIDWPDRDWIAERVEGYVLKDARLDYLIDVLEALGSQSGDVATLSLPNDPAGVSQARRFLRMTLHQWDRKDLIDSVELVVSELVTNAIRHARSAPDLRLSLTGSAVRVEVFDDGFGTPDPHPPSELSERGRGMYLIDALSAAWGIEMIPERGKVVWAELPRGE